MGDELGRVHLLLSDHLAWLYAKWAEFRVLFGTDRARIELLDKAAPTFFAYVQQILWSDLMLGVRRLTDPRRTGGKDNLTVCRLPSLVQDHALRAEVEVLLQRVKSATSFARTWSNREVAHLDLARALSPEFHPLQPATLKEVKEALDALAVVLNLLQTRLCASSTAYQHSMVTGGGAHVLLRRLGSAMKHSGPGANTTGCTRTAAPVKAVMKRLPMTQARNELSSLPERLAEEPDTVVVVTRQSRPVLAILPWEIYEELLETLEIMADPKLMAALRKSLEQADRGETFPLEQIEAELRRQPGRSR